MLTGAASAERGSTPVDADLESRSALPTPLILISLDGFRADYLSRRTLPNLQRLIDEGAHAGALIQFFPTKTFPAHYSLVTGLYPAQHGVVGNSMYDPRSATSFTMRDREAVSDPFWWGGEPIWLTAMQQGLIAATFFWPGSEAPVGGRRPDIWFPYDGSVPYPERVDRVLGWLARPDATRPSLITLYFDRVDSVGHWSGPDSPEVEVAIDEVDAMIGRLLDGLERSGRLDQVNLIVVSDHGMLPLPPEQRLTLQGHVDLSRIRVSDYGPVTLLEADPDYEQEAWALLSDFHPRVRAFRPEQLPEQWRFRDHPRIPGIVLLADPGWSVERPAFGGVVNPNAGSHGWAPETPGMHAIFLARGPGFRAGARIDCLHAVHIYAMMAELLKLDPADNEGDPAQYASLMSMPQAESADSEGVCPHVPLQ